MQINPYLHFSGTCEEAFNFYEAALGGKIASMMTYKDAPVEVPAEWRGKIMHATLAFGDTVVMGCDSQPAHYEKPAGFAISLNMTEAAEAGEIFEKLAEGGNIRMPLQKTFWAQAFGMVTDRFGTPWMVNCML